MMMRTPLCLVILTREFTTWECVMMMMMIIIVNMITVTTLKKQLFMIHVEYRKGYNIGHIYSFVLGTCQPQWLYSDCKGQSKFHRGGSTSASCSRFTTCQHCFSVFVIKARISKISLFIILLIIITANKMNCIKVSI